MKRPAVLIAALFACLPSAGMAEPHRPDTGYFTGVYERVGRSGGAKPALIDELIRIDPASDGWGLVLSRCGGGASLVLRPDSYAEVPNLLTGAGDSALWCQYFNDHGNYPVLTCSAEDGLRFTLWAVTGARAAECGGWPGDPP